MNGEVSESLATHISTVVFPRPTRSAEAAPDSTPVGCSVVAWELSEGFTAQDIDILIGAVLVPFDFSLFHHHIASR